MNLIKDIKNKLERKYFLNINDFATIITVVYI